MVMVNVVVIPPLRREDSILHMKISHRKTPASLEGMRWMFSFPLKFDRHISSTTAKTPIFPPNLMDSRLCEILLDATERVMEKYQQKCTSIFYCYQLFDEVYV